MPRRLANRPDPRLLDAFLRVVAAVVLFNQQVAERLQLGPTHMQFMTHLQLRGPLTPGELAELSGLRSGTVTGVIDRLEEAGFVRRTRDDRDRRKLHVVLNEERVARDVAPLYARQADRLAAAASAFTESERDVIVRFLELLGEEGAGELATEAR